MTPTPKPGACLHHRLEDLEPLSRQLHDWAESHVFLGGLVPYYHVEFGADHFSALLGCEFKWSAGAPSPWMEHFVEDWDAVEIKFNPENRWWVRTVEFIRTLRRRFDGKILITGPTLVANLDALVALRGVDRLMVDLVDQPEKIQQALSAIDRAYGEIMDALDRELDFARWGSIGRHGLYSTGRKNVPQCDCSCMISPEMFATFVLPALKREIAHLDASVYHLDGPDALKHLDAVCSLKKLDIVQFQPGAGKWDLDWSEVFRRIDRNGKGNLIIGQQHGVGVEDIRRIWLEYASRKIAFYANTMTYSDAMRLLEQTEQLRK